MIRASACGKIILCGEHAVVYHQPALALPLSGLRAEAQLTACPDGPQLEAPDLQLRCALAPDKAHPHPLEMTIWRALEYFQSQAPKAKQSRIERLGPVLIRVQSQIPMGCGLGSGTAISAALFRLLAQHCSFQPSRSAELAFIHEIETLYHGHPSGIDGEVISREMALRFQRDRPAQPLNLTKTSHSGVSLLIGHSGPAAPTHEVVGFVRQQYQAEAQRYEHLFTTIGALCREAETALQNADWPKLGPLLNQNHRLLQEMGVSSPALDQFVSAAREAGALGAKLSGAGWGGVCLALCQRDEAQAVTSVWKQRGSAFVLERPF